MTTATAASTTTVAPTAMPTRTRKQGVWGSLTSVTGSLANVVTDFANVGSSASEGLWNQAESYRLSTLRDLIEEFGSIEEIENLNSLADQLRAAAQRRRS